VYQTAFNAMMKMFEVDKKFSVSTAIEKNWRSLHG
jgi:hypothetical protein